MGLTVLEELRGLGGALVLGAACGSASIVCFLGCAGAPLLARGRRRIVLAAGEKLVNLRLALLGGSSRGQASFSQALGGRLAIHRAVILRPSRSEKSKKEKSNQSATHSPQPPKKRIAITFRGNPSGVIESKSEAIYVAPVSASLETT
jgi:hypothetical protein